MIGMKDCFFSKNVMSPLLQCLHQTIEFLVIGVVINFGLRKSLWMVGYWMTSLFKYNPNGELRCIYLNFKGLIHVQQA